MSPGYCNVYGFFCWFFLITHEIQKPVPLMEAKAPPPKFDLAASNFPPLPGSVATVQGETVTEMRLSDVVRGLKVPTKVLFLTLNFYFFFVE